MNTKTKKGRLVAIEYQIPVCSTEKICSPDAAYEILKPDFNLLAEEMYVLVLNNQHNVLHKIMILRGEMNMLMCTPANIFRSVLIAGGNAFLLAHNHPSGSLTPSEEDKVFTTKVSKAASVIGLKMLDHIIFTDSGFFSFKQNNLF